MGLPLAGLTILAIEQFGAGPFATLQLADLGARVIKIEDPGSGGDVGRYVPPFQDGEDSLYFESLNRNKASVSLDLRHADGRRVFEDLVRASDVVFSNLRGDQPEKLGITYAQLCDVNPRIVCCSLTGFGMTGPRAKQGGYDPVMQAYAGWMTLTGDPASAPTKTGLSLVDLATGYVAAIAMLAGVRRAEHDGVGCDCDVSLFETALALLSYIGAWAASAGYEPRRMPQSAHQSIVPFQAFEASDGWLVVACAKEKFWHALCHAIERPDLLEDERYAGFARRDANRDTLLPILAQTLRTRPVASWIAAFEAHGVPAGPVNTVAEALVDAQTVARAAIVETDHPRLGSVRSVATPLRVGPEPKPNRRAPLRGEDTAAVLRELCGYAVEQIERLDAAGLFGTTHHDGEVTA